MEGAVSPSPKLARKRGRREARHGVRPRREKTNISLTSPLPARAMLQEGKL